MTSALSNARGHSPWIHVGLLGIATLAPLFVTAVPLSRMDVASPALRGEIETLEASFAELRGASESSAGDGASDLALLADARAAFQRRIPALRDELTLHGSLRIAARLAGLELTQLALNVPRALDSAPGGVPDCDTLWVFDAQLTGAGELEAWTRLVEVLQVQGQPASVASLELIRSADASGGWSARASLVLYARGDMRAAMETSSR